MKTIIKSSTIAGEGLFAEEDILAGDQILSLTSPKYSVVDSTQLPNVCSRCFLWTSSENYASQDNPNHTITLKICTGCRTHRYCSKQCQAEIWPSHKRECKLLGRLSAKGVLPNAVRLVLQISSHKTADHTPLSKLYSHLPEIVSAASAADERFKQEKYENLQIFSKGVYEYTGKKIDYSLIQVWFAKVYTNALTVTSATFDPLGICVDEFASKANHSCDPNAFIVFDGIGLNFRALKPIKKDDEITISYIDNTRQFAVRQKELRDLYYFKCDCSTCKAGASLKADHCFRRIKDEKDSNCGTVTVATSDLPQDITAMIERRTESAYEKLEEVKQATSPAEAVTQVQGGIEQCLRYGIWPPYRQPLPSLRHEAFINLLSLGQWTLAFKQGLTMYFITHPILYPEGFHPLRLVQKWALAKLALFIAEDQSDGDRNVVIDQRKLDMGVVVLGFLIETLNNVKLSHGKAHTFAGVVKAKYDQVVTDMTRGDENRLISLESRIKHQWEILRQLATSDEAN